MPNLMLKDQIFALPSQGQANPDNNWLGTTSIKLRPFVAADQKILAGMSGDSYRIYRNLLSRVIVEPQEVDLDELLMSDVNAILFAVRMLSYGPEYKMTYKCPNCGSQEEAVIDVNALDVIFAEGKDTDFDGTGITEIDGQEVEFQLPRLKHEKQANQMTNHAKRRGGDFAGFDVEKAFIRMALMVKTVDGEKLNSHKSVDYIQNLSMPDFDDLSAAITAADTGLQTDIELDCSNCGWVTDTLLQVDAEFFRPKRKRG